MKIINKNIALLLTLILSLSCSSDLDFNQVNNLKVTPVVVANLAAFDVAAKDFVTGGTEQTVSVAVPSFDVFRDNFFKDNLQRADLFFEFNNTINRAYTVDLVLIDINDTPIYSIQFSIPAYTGVPNLVTKTEIFENTKLDLLKSTAKIGFVLTMLPGPILNESSPGSLKLRSSATVYLVAQ